MGATGRNGDGRGRLGARISGAAVALGCVLFLGGFVWGALVYRPYTVPTGSMSPTVNAGDKVLAQRVDGDEVRRGDVVVFTDPEWGDLPMVKRIVGVGGDKIVCCGEDGRLTVNGIPVDEPYLRSSGRASGRDFTAEVPEGRLFLLGDDRTVSLDSRVHLEDAAHGTVPRDSVEARIDAVAWPLGSMIGRPEAFAALPGGISSAGPLRLQLTAMGVGVVLIFGGAVYGPLAARAARPRRNAKPGVAAGAR
ncbi:MULTISPECIES: signal peptidase I [unclassified Streptomyces]|uniref:signal peptidase I n=1 Tax=unclassified Streptomyces TaxID=2593676 RepID=UPI000DAE0EB3|nr:MULTISPECIES: signal peptidase I [unclassified Streptomyces]PZT76975.1 signal peptidase I [Streptomyces sp. AC1-42W]PZT79069.1 signal peptidase I [Streptomyces sp. AC1-42T]